LEGSDEGEVQSEEDRGSGTPACKSDAQIEKELLSISPISDDSEAEKDSDQEGKSKQDHGKHPKDKDDGNGPAGGGSGSGNTGSDNLPEGRGGCDENQGHDENKSSKSSSKSSSHHEKEHKKSHHSHVSFLHAFFAKNF